MKAIFSYWSAGSRFFCDKEMASIANSLAQKNGYKTCLYTDAKGLNLLKEVKYDEIVLFDELTISKFFPKIWSLGKILAMSLVKEPFVHLDFDLFLFKKLDDEIEKKDFFSLYPEPWLDLNLNVREDAAKILSVYPNQENLDMNALLSSNFAVVGGQKFEEINNVCNKILNFGTLYKDSFIEMEKNGFKAPSWILAVTFEQILIPNLLKQMFDIENYHIIPMPKFIIDSIDIHEGEIVFDEQCIDYLKNQFVLKKIVHLHGDKKEKLMHLKNKLYQFI
jgi:hypothetical protein